MERMATIRLQVAMAFGQGAGSMLASLDALDSLASTQNDLLELG
jgi:hypothetical protein